ncbi:MAG TPA: response regulator [Actinomycetota bacterium]|jgi:DNA-binding NarL/FixJ family response regulator|nr:response regulator [Actinomycetota bacterium]
MAVKIVLVDDQPVPGLTLRRWLKKERELEVVGEAVPGSPALALIQITEPDLVLLDLLTSLEAGLNMARLIREQYPDLPIVAIGEATDGRVRAEAAQAGAWAYFPKKRAEDLTTAIRSVINGKGKRFQDLTDRVFERPPADSFVAGPSQAPRSRAPESPPPVPPVVAAPRKPPKPAAEPLVAVRKPAAEPLVAAAPKPAPAPAVAVRKPAVEPLVAAAPKPAAAPAVAVRKPAVEPLVGAPKPTARLPVKPKAVEVKRAAPARGAIDAVAWVSSSVEPSSFELAQRKRRRSSKKNEQVPQEIEVRGPTGLPRRSGRHR